METLSPRVELGVGGAWCGWGLVWVGLGEWARFIHKILFITIMSYDHSYIQVKVRG